MRENESASIISRYFILSGIQYDSNDIIAGDRR
jgi:hypothetical protein